MSTKLSIYEIKFDFYSFDEGFWMSLPDEKITIEDVVAVTQRGKQRTWTLTQKKYNHKNDMLQFLYNKAKCVVEDPKLKDRPLKQRLGVYLTLHNIQSFYMDTEWRQILFEIESWTILLEASVKRTVHESTLAIDVDIESFVKAVEHVQQNAATPILDLSHYLDNEGFIIAQDFVKVFNAQVKHNFDNLAKLEMTMARHHLNVHAQYIKSCFDYKAPKVFSKGTLPRLQKLYTAVVKMKDELINLLDYCRSHYNFCKDLLNQYQVERFEPSRLESRVYLEKHTKIFSDIFDSNQVCFPVTIPCLSELRDNLVEISNENEFNNLKRIYIQINKEIELTKNAVPTTWPQTLPNLSTHDGNPSILVKNSQDFQTILVSYATYLKKVLTLSDGWCLSIRKLFEFLDAMSCFGPDYDYVQEQHPKHISFNQLDSKNSLPQDKPEKIDKLENKEKQDKLEITTKYLPHREKNARLVLSFEVKDETVVTRISEASSHGRGVDTLHGKREKWGKLKIRQTKPKSSTKNSTTPNGNDRTIDKDWLIQVRKSWASISPKIKEGYDRDDPVKQERNGIMTIKAEMETTEVKTLLNGGNSTLSEKSDDIEMSITNYTELEQFSGSVSNSSESSNSELSVPVYLEHIPFNKDRKKRREPLSSLPSYLKASGRSVSGHVLSSSSDSNSSQSSRGGLAHLFSKTTSPPEQPSLDATNNLTEGTCDQTERKQAEIMDKNLQANNRVEVDPGVSVSSPSDVVSESAATLTDITLTPGKDTISIPLSVNPVQHYTTWTIEEVGEWVASLNLDPAYKSIFINHKVNGQKLDRISEEVLERLGISVWGDRIDILDSLEELKKVQGQK